MFLRCLWTWQVLAYYILANFQISERGTNERKKFKKRNIPKFPIHYYTKIAAKTGTHDKIILFFASKRGTVPPKEEQLASMILRYASMCLANRSFFTNMGPIFSKNIPKTWVCFGMGKNFLFARKLCKMGLYFKIKQCYYLTSSTLDHFIF